MHRASPSPQYSIIAPAIFERQHQLITQLQDQISRMQHAARDCMASMETFKQQLDKIDLRYAHTLGYDSSATIHSDYWSNTGDVLKKSFESYDRYVDSQRQSLLDIRKTGKQLADSCKQNPPRDFETSPTPAFYIPADTVQKLQRFAALLSPDTSRGQTEYNKLYRELEAQGQDNADLFHTLVSQLAVVNNRAIGFEAQTHAITRIEELAPQFTEWFEQLRSDAHDGLLFQCDRWMDKACALDSALLEASQLDAGLAQVNGRRGDRHAQRVQQQKTVSFVAALNKAEPHANDTSNQRGR